MGVSDHKQVEFLLFIQRILEEGQFVSTYKFALLQAIANVCVERGAGDGPLVVSARELAEQFVRLYWRQTNEFRGTELRHTTHRQAAIVTFVKYHVDQTNGSIVALRHNVDEWHNLIMRVAKNIVDMPLWRLQTVGQIQENFLYTRGETRNQIIIPPEIAFCFRQFYGLVIELTQSAWTNFVSSIGANRDVIGTHGELHEFLFGADRSSLVKFAEILRQIQSGHCFYCSRHIPAGEANVDHFIPWSRYPSDLGHNFVLSDNRCNNQKRDRLAAVKYLEKWSERNALQGEVLSEEFSGRFLSHNIETSRRIAFFAYERAEKLKAQVWTPPKDLETLGGDWRAALQI